MAFTLSRTCKSAAFVLFGLLAHCSSESADTAPDMDVSSGDEQPLVSEDRLPADLPPAESESTSSFNPCDGQPKFPDGSEMCNSSYPSWVCCGKVRNDLPMTITVAGNRSSGGTGLQPYYTLSAGGTTGANRDIDAIWVPVGWAFKIKGFC